MRVEADQDLIVYFDGRYMPLRDAHVGILTHALHYGTGVFEGIRAYATPQGPEQGWPPVEVDARGHRQLSRNTV